MASSKSTVEPAAFNPLGDSVDVGHSEGRMGFAGRSEVRFNAEVDLRSPVSSHRPPRALKLSGFSSSRQPSTSQ